MGAAAELAGGLAVVAAEAAAMVRLLATYRPELTDGPNGNRAIGAFDQAAAALSGLARRPVEP